MVFHINSGNDYLENQKQPIMLRVFYVFPIATCLPTGKIGMPMHSQDEVKDN
jgi:hypothetical protein